MRKEIRNALTPQEYIERLFADTKDGNLKITYYPYNLMEPYTLSYAMDWTAEDAKALAQRYEALVSALHTIGESHDSLDDPEAREKLLNADELQVWETYIKPFPEFEVDEHTIAELYYRAEYDCIEEDEDELLRSHYWWRQCNSLERLPFLRRSPSDLILRAMRYEKLVSIEAPEVIIQEEGLSLAEEMVLYYHGPQEKQTFPEDEYEA